MRKRFLRIFETDLAIDLGTANTLIYSSKRGVVLNEPSVIAIDRDKGGAELFSGSEAKRMIGRVPAAVSIVRPVRTGVVAELDLTVRMLRSFLKRALDGSFRLTKPRVVVGVPPGASEVEKRAIIKAVAALASEVTLIDEALAAAIGAGLPVAEASGTMIVDIGGGTTDVAVISMNQIVCSASVPVAGDMLDQVVCTHLRKQHHLRIGETTAELIKIVIGCAHPDFDGQEMKVAGQDLTTGLPKEIVVSSAEIRQCMEPHVQSIIAGIREVLEQVPPELMGDVMSNGITLTGGGALLKGFDRRIAEELSIPAKVAPNAASAVAEGAGKRLEQQSGRKRKQLQSHAAA